jgi:predicted ATPase
MKLAKVQVHKFRNFLDSGEVEIQPDVTCTVGKNEAGKSAFLNALYRLQPARGNAVFDLKDYPAWIKKKDEMRGHKLADVRPVQAVFLLEDEDKEAVAEELGHGILTGDTLSIERSYAGTLYWDVETDEVAAVRLLRDGLTLPTEVAKQVETAKTLAALRRLVAVLQADAENSEHVQAGSAIAAKVKETYGDKSTREAAFHVLMTRIPKFFYFSEYSSLPYTVKIHHVLKASDDQLNDSEITARALLRMGAATNEDLLSRNYESRKRELESVANALTDDVLKYWTQNPNLHVYPDVERGDTPQNDELKLRIRDDRHQLSLPFSEHSTGFRWFFSFLAAFSEFEKPGTRVIILLDEPALGLHARAQADFLRFIDERLSQDGRQVIYTTHSPFMVQPGKLERVRLVFDEGRDTGSKVTANVMSTDADTLFPLQSALGYDMVQHLFISPHNLVVEGTSDYTYLRVVSDYLAEQGGREVLDSRWSIVPVGSADYVPTFVALLGRQLDVTVVVDSQKAGHQRLDELVKSEFLPDQRVITIGQVLGQKLADVEDLFDTEDYLHLFNDTFGTTYTSTDLTGTDPIASRLARKMGKPRYDHGKPADTFLRKRDKILPTLSKVTLDNFEKLFRVVNASLNVPMPAKRQ